MIVKIPKDYYTIDLQEGYWMWVKVYGHDIELTCIDGKVLYLEPAERHQKPNKKYGYWKEWKDWKGWCK